MAARFMFHMTCSSPTGCPLTEPVIKLHTCLEGALGLL
jgi:hypothetical protein